MQTPEAADQPKRRWWHVSRADTAELGGAVLAAVWGYLRFGTVGAVGVAAVCLLTYGMLEGTT